MSGKKSSHVSKTQKNILLDMLKERPHLRNGKFTVEFTYKKAQEEWQQIAEVLNAIPGSNKDWKMWRKTWQDLLSKVKCKSAAINKSRRMTGGGPAPDPLDEFEEGMATLLNLNSIVGHEGVEESLVIFEEFEFVNADHISDHTYPSTSVDHTSDYLMENGNNDVSIPPPALFQDTENQDPNTTVDTQNTSGPSNEQQRTRPKKKINMKTLLKEKVEIKKTLALAKINFYRDLLEIQNQRNVILKELCNAFHANSQ